MVRDVGGMKSPARLRNSGQSERRLSIFLDVAPRGDRCHFAAFDAVSRRPVTAFRGVRHRSLALGIVSRRSTSYRGVRCHFAA